MINVVWPVFVDVKNILKMTMVLKLVAYHANMVHKIMMTSLETPTNQKVRFNVADSELKIHIITQIY